MTTLDSKLNDLIKAAKQAVLNTNNAETDEDIEICENEEQKAMDIFVEFALSIMPQNIANEMRKKENYFLFRAKTIDKYILN